MLFYFEKVISEAVSHKATDTTVLSVPTSDRPVLFVNPSQNLREMNLSQEKRKQKQMLGLYFV